MVVVVVVRERDKKHKLLPTFRHVLFDYSALTWRTRTDLNFLATQFLTLEQKTPHTTQV